jgi:hypothetical protein
MRNLFEHYSREFINESYADGSRLWYHGSESEHGQFDNNLAGSKLGNSPGLWFTDNPDLMGFYGHVQYTVKLHISNPKIITEDEWDALPRNERSPSVQAVHAYMEDHDALVIENIIDGDQQATNICVFDDSDIEIVNVENTDPDREPIEEKAPSPYECMAPVRSLRKVWNPFERSPWPESPSLTPEDIRVALASVSYSEDRYDDVLHDVRGSGQDSKDYHAQRVAYLVEHPSNEPIKVIRNHLGSYEIDDGWHRLAAAIYLDAPEITVHVDEPAHFLKWLSYYDLEEGFDYLLDAD